MKSKSILEPSSLYQVAEISITYSCGIRPIDRPQITSSWQAHDIFIEVWEKDTIGHREQLRVMLLNRSNKVLGVYLLSSGGIAGTVCDPKLLFQAALKANASSIILAHNHPSGNLTPSEADVKLTKKLVAAGKFLDLPVSDHLILTEQGYLSMAEEGLM